jgi:hypothetical protein
MDWVLAAVGIQKNSRLFRSGKLIPSGSLLIEETTPAGADCRDPWISIELLLLGETSLARDMPVARLLIILQRKGKSMSKYVIIVASLLVVAVTGAPAWAAWGCGAVSTQGAQGRSWGGSLASARQAALSACRHEYQGPCHIISCRQPVDTHEDAVALWPPSAPENCIGHC